MLTFGQKLILDILKLPNSIRCTMMKSISNKQATTIDSVYEHYWNTLAKSDTRKVSSCKPMEYSKLTPEIINQLWTRNRKHLFECIMNEPNKDDSRLNLQNAYEHFSRALNSNVDYINFMPRTVNVRNSIKITEYITETELLSKLNKPKKSVCPLEHVSRGELSKHFSETRALLNMTLYQQEIPQKWKQLEIGLKKTKSNSISPLDYCIIVIEPITYRLFSGILYDRINNQLKHHPNQIGFNHKNYKLEMNLLIKYLIDEKKVILGNVSLANKFNSIRMETLIPLLTAYGFTETDLNFIWKIYENCTGYLSYKKSKSKEMLLGNVIRQGDPLATAFSTMLIEQLLMILNDQSFGVLIEQHKLSALAYFDNMILFANNQFEMNKLIQVVAKFYVGLGMNVRQEVKVNVITGMFHTTENTKLLGYDVQNRPVSFYKEVIETFFHKLSRVPLSSEQKLYFVQENLKCNLVDMLKYKYYSKEELGAIEAELNKHVKSVNQQHDVDLAKQIVDTIQDNLAFLEHSTTWFIEPIVRTNWFHKIREKY